MRNKWFVITGFSLYFFCFFNSAFFSTSCLQTKAETELMHLETQIFFSPVKTQMVSFMIFYIFQTTMIFFCPFLLLKKNHIYIFPPKMLRTISSSRHLDCVCALLFRVYRHSKDLFSWWLIFHQASLQSQMFTHGSCSVQPQHAAVSHWAAVLQQTGEAPC